MTAYNDSDLVGFVKFLESCGYEYDWNFEFTWDINPAVLDPCFQPKTS